ncbi:MAG: hypothetical protein GF310_14010 [candidate division Zixibacteria bacterium]|nr:hypothetical protein [candidate division Zixibacteria bacterium]
MRRVLVLTCLPAVLVMAWALALSAQGTLEGDRLVPEIEAFRINPHPPVIDGNLDDPVWQHDELMLVSKFIQREPDEGKEATESTLVAVAYDDDAVYVAFWCYDSEPDKMIRQLVRRDRWSESDRVTVRIDPFHDHQNGHAFEVSSAGVLRDARYFDDVGADMSWDAVWDAKVKKHSWGWGAEFKIPYHCLRFTEKEEHTWGIDFQRYISHNGETDIWAYTPPSKGGFVSNFGHVRGLRGIHSSGRIELMPYAVSSTETEPKSAGNPDGRDFMGDMGFDVKYALSSNLILDATINPDFGQVELDQPVLNLSAYETYFPERRPFFLEGSDLFNTDFDLFYSRRIGRPPRQNVDDDELGFYKDYPNETTILGAAKLTGKLSSGTSIAFLNAVTAEEEAEYAALSNYRDDTTWVDGEPVVESVPQDTTYRKGVVEKSANYSVLRIKQDIFGSSHVGGMLTMASQESLHPAVTGGIDWRLASGNSMWVLSGQTVFSRVDSRETGFGFEAQLDKAAGDHFRGAVGVEIKDPNLNLNRLGFIYRNSNREVWSWFQYRTRDDWWIVRNSWNNLNFHSSWNYDGINNSLGGNFNTNIEFTNYWSMSWSFSVQAEKYSDLETRGNGLWEWPVYPTAATWLNISTDQRKNVSFHAGIGGGDDRGGNHRSIHFDVNTRPRSNIEFTTGIALQRYNNAKRWVTNAYDENDKLQSVFGDLDQDVINLYMSGNWLLSRDLSLQFSAVGLLSGLDYQNYRNYLGGNEYSDPLDEFDNDYSYSAINSTLLLRWEYIPGSTLYMVWTRARPEVDGNTNSLVLDRDLDRFFSAGSTNVFLIKVSYWLNI